MADKRKKKAAKPKKDAQASRAVTRGKGATLRSRLLDLIDLVFRPGAQEAGEIIQNELHSFKTKRLLVLNDKLRDELTKRQVVPEDARPLPPGLGTKILGHAAIEDEDEVADLWAKLIASGLGPKDKPIDRVFVGILSEIGALEVRIMRFLWLRLTEGDLKIRMIRHEKVSRFSDENLRPRSASERAIAIQNLVRQRCVRMALDDYYLDQIEVQSSMVLTPGERLTGRSGGDAIRQTQYAIQAIRRLLEDFGGLRDSVYLGLEQDDGDSVEPFPELSFELTELGVELMRRCEPIE